MSRVNNLVESNYTLSLTEQRILYLATRQLRSIYMKMNIKPSEIRESYKSYNFDIIKVFVIDLKREYKLTSNNIWGILEDAAIGLNTKTISYMKDDGFYEDRRIGAFEYNHEESCIEIRFNPDLIVDLIALKEFYGKYRYIAAREFKKTSSYRLYELFKECAVLGIERKFSLEQIKLRLGLEMNSYSDTYELKRGLIWKCTKEIIKFTDIESVGYDEEREGKKTVGFIFNVKLKSEPSDSREILQDKFYKPTKEEIGRMSFVTGIDLNEAQAEKLIAKVITTIAWNSLDIGFYDYLKTLSETSVIWSLI